MRKWLWLVILLFIITSPILIWHAKPTKKINLLIFDKTVPDDTFREHQGLTWLVNYKKYNQPSGAPYRKETDYAGTVPIAEKNIQIELSRNYPTHRSSFIQLIHMESILPTLKAPVGNKQKRMDGAARALL